MARYSASPLRNNGAEGNTEESLMSDFQSMQVDDKKDAARQQDNEIPLDEYKNDQQHQHQQLQQLQQHDNAENSNLRSTRMDDVRDDEKGAGHRPYNQISLEQDDEDQQQRRQHDGAEGNVEESLMSDFRSTQVEEKKDAGNRPYNQIPLEEYDEEQQQQKSRQNRTWLGFISRYGQLSVIILLATTLLWSFYTRGVPTLQLPSQTSTSHPVEFFLDLYLPLVPKNLAEPVTYFSDITNTTRSLSLGDSIWTTPLRKDILILDLDTRPYNASNQMLHDGIVAWEDLDRSSAGLLNHYLYSLIHGYDYKFIKPVSPLDRFASWTKPSSMRSVLKENPHYRFVVFSDADALWNHPEIPLEALLNHWNITRETCLSISRDPAKYHDKHGNPGLNTGFIIAQNTERTLDILEAWADCPDRYEGCDEYKNKRVFEQSAFSEYVRYDFDRADDVKALPCDESDGYLNSPDHCSGEIVRHFWRQKDLIKWGVSTSLMSLMSAKFEELRTFFVQHKAELVVEDEEKKKT